METPLFGKTVENKKIILKCYANGTPLETDMELKVGEVLKLEVPKGSNGVLVKNLYLSCDPYMRGCMQDFHVSYISPFSPGSAIEGFGVSEVVDSDDPSFKRGEFVAGLTNWEEYTLIHKTGQLRKIQQDDAIPLSYHVGLLGMPGFTAYAGFYEVCAPKKGEYVYVSAASGAVGQLVGQLAKLHGCYVVGSAGTSQKPTEGNGVSRVVDSNNPDFKAGDLVSGLTNWEEYSVIKNTGQLKKLQKDDDIPLSYHLGLLGSPGFTAYAGFYEVCAPKKGDYVYVSAASSAVGQLVGQLAKLHGCYVVGSTGTNQKVELLKNKLGFDEAFNYKEESDLEAALARYFPQGIDVYFDNVGGKMLDATIANMRNHGRITLCGILSQNNRNDPQSFCNMFSVISKGITMKGFLMSDYMHLYPRFLEDVTRFYKEGKIVYLEDMNNGLESAPAAFVGLFTGKNVGKQVIRVANE